MAACTQDVIGIIDGDGEILFGFYEGLITLQWWSCLLWVWHHPSSSVFALLSPKIFLSQRWDWSHLLLLESIYCGNLQFLLNSPSKWFLHTFSNAPLLPSCQVAGTEMGITEPTARDSNYFQFNQLITCLSLNHLSLYIVFTSPQ